jgi:valyl-tRNA synthetase
MGHALNTVLQDILSRWKRMTGFSVLWVPGMDHAGIATQNVVEKQLASDGIDRHQLGRKEFTERVWKWKSEYGGRIIHQLKRLGASADWTRERFTLDEGLSRAVREVFVRLYEEGLIYRDNRLINWCPRCHTALSDLEVEYEEIDGKLTYINYPITDKRGVFITVATTRPETMLGDTAVAVHPEDERYHAFIGKTINLPLTERTIPVIADDAVDPAFGTGAVKVTPAHDFKDEAIAKRKTPPLEFVKVLGDNGRMTSQAGKRYANMDRYECRKAVIRDLAALDLIVKEDPHRHAIGHCYRCKTITEPLPTLQWYVNVQSMAKEAMRAVRNGHIRIIPRTWENTYFAWMEEIKDWCISRQIWWGHRIPVWYCKDKKNKKCREKDGIFVSRHDPEKCPYCASPAFMQDEDVLDTWFSSALWPFSTLGWPDQTDDLKKYYPTSVLVTGFDIIFFWVARMIMAGQKFMGEVPFRDVYIHALVRDMSGQKMSKSKGNVVDPLIMIDRYGTDAFRFTLAAFAAQGRDIKFDENRVEGYRHFVNKLWNAARFIMMNVTPGQDYAAYEVVPVRSYSSCSKSARPGDLASRWILSRLSAVTGEMSRALEEYRYNDAVNSIYQFIWHEFCDWYIELAKIELKDKKSEKGVTWCLLYCLDSALRLLHPVMPFVTEEIWQQVRSLGGELWRDATPDSKEAVPESVMMAEFPHSIPRDLPAESDMSYIMEAVNGIRNIRGELNIAPSLKLKALVKPLSRKAEKILKENISYLKSLARAGDLDIDMHIKKATQSATSVKNSMELYVPLKGILNISSEMQRLRKEGQKVQESLDFLNKKLHNEDFLERAPKEIVTKEKAKYEELINMKDRISQSIQTLKDVEVQDDSQKDE